MIKVELPNTTSTGILKTCQHLELTIKGDTVIKSSRLVEFVNEDGTPYAPTDLTEKQQYLPRVINLSTEGRFVGPDGIACLPDAEGAVSEMDYYKSIPLAAVPAEVTTIFGAVEWLIKNSMLNGNLQGRY